MKANEKGYKDFNLGKIVNPFNGNTYRHKEWQRGFNKAYFEQLEKVKSYESRRRSKKIHGA
jgi:hypothetical protein|tara:strand:- start:5287 stop:5469 length:183 start_codon:yes stop_codon:yes gene_type:complete